MEQNGDDTDIVNDLVARRRVVKQYSNVVCTFFHLKTEAFIEEVLKPVYGVSDYYIRFEYAASRGQIHFHMLAWRKDRKQKQLAQVSEAVSGRQPLVNGFKTLDLLLNILEGQRRLGTQKAKEYRAGQT